MKIKILVVAPFKRPRAALIENNRDALRKVVGGRFEVVYPYDDPVAIIGNEMGKIDGLSLNRALRGSDGVIYDIIAGTFFVCGLDENFAEFISLSPELMERYRKLFRNAEIFLNVNGKIIVV